MGVIREGQLRVDSGQSRLTAIDPEQAYCSGAEHRVRRVGTDCASPDDIVNALAVLVNEQ
ncbi:MAG: hypothetical protein EOO38_22100 [Cytophagaceae bacterium]|nr:MAG: hypothetical protein EOO38_22100 [Cytophagaceae bacterium]